MRFGLVLLGAFIALASISSVKVYQDRDHCSRPSPKSQSGDIRVQPLLVVLVDFAGDDENVAEQQWSKLMFGRNFGQANHYWQEVSYGKFELAPSEERFGCESDGVIRVRLDERKPQDRQEWKSHESDIAHRVLTSAAEFVTFSNYDQNHDGAISNQELAVLLVFDVKPNTPSGAAAMANIKADIAVGGVVVKHYMRTLAKYRSIGVNVHEIAHHVFDLDHADFGQSSANLMGMGAYNGASWGTSPAHPIAYNKERAGFIIPEEMKAHSMTFDLYAANEPNFNALKLPTFYGNLYLENRYAKGYDETAKLGEAGGGILITRVIKFAKSMPVDEASAGSPDAYLRWSDHGRETTIGGYHIQVLSPPGPKMRVRVTRQSVRPKITAYRYKYWVKDPVRQGYRLWEYQQQDLQSIDVSRVSCSHYKSNEHQCRFTITLEGLYNTGDSLSVNLASSWAIDSEHIELNKNPVNFGSDAIIELMIDKSAQPGTMLGNLSVTHDGYRNTLRIVR